jgi:uncharacterized membrane-anchored protein
MKKVIGLVMLMIVLLIVIGIIIEFISPNMILYLSIIGLVLGGGVLILLDE